MGTQRASAPTERADSPGERRAIELFPPSDITEFVPDEQWEVYRVALAAARSIGAPFAVGGGLAVSFYTGHWRNSKDIDLYVVPGHRHAMIDALTRADLADYFDVKEYDRAWIHRAHRGDVIVDVIWALANGADDVDRAWLERGAVTDLRGEPIRLVAREEIFWSKVHVVQRERCDWPDLMNMLYAQGPSLDWHRLAARHAGEERLLASVVQLFAWLAPGRAAELPEWLWDYLSIEPPPEDAPLRDALRIERLDSRPWFTPVALR